MPSREYHEASWAAIPHGCEPSDSSLRLRFVLASVAPGERVLDVGCGEGRFTAELHRHGARVVAADVADEPLRRAREREPALELCLLPAEGEWPLAIASFDVVWAGEVIEHVADTAAWFSEARRVLRPGGRLLLSTPAHGLLTRLALARSEHAFARHFDPLGEHLRFYTRASLRGLLEDFGFERIDVRGAGRRPTRPLLLASAVRRRF
jgi:2-polyprenyl-3-methyl-5-hydroxy-6-metoxy-1,4-benzoquinol methylase